MEYAKKRLENYIEAIDKMLIKLFIDAYYKNGTGIDVFLNNFGNSIDGLKNAYEELDFAEKRNYSIILDRYARIWESLFINGHKISVPFYAQSAIINCLKNDIDSAKRSLKMDENEESMRFLLEHFRKDNIDETLKYIIKIGIDIGEKEGFDLIMNKMFGDSSYFAFLTKGIDYNYEKDITANIYINYKMQLPLQNYLQIPSNYYNGNYYLKFINQNVAICSELRVVYEKWLNDDKTELIKTNQSESEIRNHFEPLLLDWYNSDDVEYFFHSNFICFNKNLPIRVLKSIKPEKEQRGLQTKLRKLVYNFWFKEGIGAESQERYARMLKMNFDVFSNTSLTSITDNFSR